MKDRELVKKEVERVRRRAAESLGFQPRRVVQIEDMRSLVQEWAAAWIICLEVLPEGWSIR